MLKSIHFSSFKFLTAHKQAKTSELSLTFKKEVYVKLVICGLCLFFGLSSVQANPIESCLNSANTWIYSNTPASQNEAAEQAVPFCTKGGDVSCLNPAKSWIYSKTSRSQNEAVIAAITFCTRGEVTCLETTANWIFRNTSANQNQAAEQAITACGEKKTCEAR